MRQYNIFLQQVPEEIERVMAAVEAYLRIRKQDYGVGLTVLEHDKAHAEKVNGYSFLILKI